MDVLFINKMLIEQHKKENDMRENEGTNVRTLLVIALGATLLAAMLTFAGTCSAHHEGTDDDIHLGRYGLGGQKRQSRGEDHSPERRRATPRFDRAARRAG